MPRHAITVRRVVSAAHAIRLYDGSLEPVHGHDWAIEVTVAADQLDDIEVVMDFHALEKSLDALLAPVHNRNFNDLPPFAGDGPHGLAINPSAERVAQWVGESIANDLPDHARLESVSVSEAPGCVATYQP